MSELKPCPFCGGQAELDFARNTSFTYTDVFGKTIETGLFYTAKCRDDSCGCKIGVYKEPQMAIEAWNRRVNHDSKRGCTDN